MFLCKPCHDASGCGWGDLIHLQSRGLCECCRKAAVCSDCHSYDFRGSGHNHFNEADAS
jgi:hypothetical protein